jgi:hypothetical protein
MGRVGVGAAYEPAPVKQSTEAVPRLSSAMQTAIRPFLRTRSSP